MDPIKIGKFIYNLRIKNNLTQSELASKLSVTSQAISKWENGRGIPDIEMLKKLSEEFNIDISELINGEIKIKKKNYNIIGVILTVIVFILVLAVSKYNTKKEETFNFSTLASSNELFNIKGIMAYDKNKKSIYISEVEYLEFNNDKDEYVVMECILYETNNDTDKKISQCGNIDTQNKINSENSKTLKELLKGIEFNIDGYSCNCNSNNCNNLYLKINVLNINNQVVTYEIPIEIDKKCSN